MTQIYMSFQPQKCLFFSHSLAEYVWLQVGLTVISAFHIIHPLADRPQIRQRGEIDAADQGMQPIISNLILLQPQKDLQGVPLSIGVCVIIQNTHVMNTAGPLIPYVPYQKVILLSLFLHSVWSQVFYLPPLCAYHKDLLSLYNTTDLDEGIIVYM